MITDFLTRHTPPGMSLKQEGTFLTVGTICSVLFSIFCFFGSYATARGELYDRIDGKWVLNVNATMPGFRSLLGYSFVGFWIVAFCMLGFAVYHYAYYRQGSMSIYLMKRLPKKAEIHKRAWTLPVIAFLLCIFAAFLLLAIYYAVYLLATPSACLPPNPWQI